MSATSSCQSHIHPSPRILSGLTLVGDSRRGIFDRCHWSCSDSAGTRRTRCIPDHKDPEGLHAQPGCCYRVPSVAHNEDIQPYQMHLCRSLLGTVRLTVTAEGSNTPLVSLSTPRNLRPQRTSHWGSQYTRCQLRMFPRDNARTHLSLWWAHFRCYSSNSALNLLVMSAAQVGTEAVLWHQRTAHSAQEKHWHMSSGQYRAGRFLGGTQCTLRRFRSLGRLRMAHTRLLHEARCQESMGSTP